MLNIFKAFLTLISAFLWHFFRPEEVPEEACSWRHAGSAGCQVGWPHQGEAGDQLRAQVSRQWSSHCVIIVRLC
jgi:hypothetical protein